MNPNHFLALIHVRFQLTFNQIRKGGQINSILFSIALVFLTLFAVSSFFGAIVFGAIWLRPEVSDKLLLTWNVLVAAFCGMWLFHVLNRIQQNDVISIDRLLHLPTTFHSAFVLNYVSSLFNFTLLSFVPVFAGLAIAMPVARGWQSSIAIPLCISFLFMVTAVTHQIREWLAEKMQNKRTKGILLAIIPLAFVAIFLTIGELTESASMTSMIKSVPLGWLPSGIMAADSGNMLTGAWGTVAMTAIGSASLFFSYRSSIRKFTGDVKISSRKATNETIASSKQWLGSSIFKPIPFASEPVSAIAWGSLRNLSRAPEIFAALIPVIVLAVFGTPYLIGWDGFVIAWWLSPLLPISLIAVALLGFPAFLFSTFSYDRDGFRAFILSPVQRCDILLGKNLAIGIPTCVLGWVTIIVLQCFVPTGVFWFLAALIHLPAAYLLLCIVGNVISVFFPVGLKRGSMTPVNAKVIPVLALYVGILIGPFVAMMPAVATYGICRIAQQASGWPLGWLYFLLSIGSLTVSWLVYRWTLKPLGNGLWNQEPEILTCVSNIPD